MEEEWGVPGGAVEQIFGSHLTVALHIQGRERCIVYRFPPCADRRTPPHFRGTLYRFSPERRPLERHRSSLPPPLPHRPHLPAHAEQSP